MKDRLLVDNLISQPLTMVLMQNLSSGFLGPIYGLELNQRALHCCFFAVYSYVRLTCSSTTRDDNLEYIPT